MTKKQKEKILWLVRALVDVGFRYGKERQQKHIEIKLFAEIKDHPQMASEKVFANWEKKIEQGISQIGKLLV